MRIGITGSNGFVGWHLRCFLSPMEGVEVVTADRATFADPQALAAFANGLDAVVHLAGVNRADTDDEVYQGNIELAQSLVDALTAAGGSPHVVFSSSTHVERDELSTYGKAKRDAASILTDWAASSGGGVTEMVIPHVFGEYGRPFYNSAVATFCHQLAVGETPVVNSNAPLELIHVQDLAQHLWEAVEKKAGGRVRLAGHHTSVEEVLAMLEEMKATYESGIVPDLADPLRVRLFNAYRSYCYPDLYPRPVVLHSDPRGHLFETFKGNSGGQCFVSTTVPGITRGNHFHRFKFERFFVLSGSARIELRKLFSTDVDAFDVTGDEPCYVDIPTLYTHNITNTGQGELVTLFWSDQLFDPENPDTYYESV